MANVAKGSQMFWTEGVGLLLFPGYADMDPHRGRGRPMGEGQLPVGHDRANVDATEMGGTFATRPRFPTAVAVFRGLVNRI